jgi:hypothetical protein
MRITVRPLADPHREVDLTHVLIATIARELYVLFGGNDQLNWLEAERHLRTLLNPGFSSSGPAPRDVRRVSGHRRLPSRAPLRERNSDRAPMPRHRA